MSGLIWGALGQAVSNAGATVGGMLYKRADEEDKRAWQERLMQLEEEKQLRLDAIRRDRDVQDIGRRTAATAQANLDAAPLVAQAGVAAEEAKLTAEDKAGLPARRADAAASAEAQRIQALMAKGVPEAQARLLVQQKLSETQAIKDSGLIAAQAGVKEAEFEAGAPLRKRQADEGTRAEMDKTKAQASDKDFVKATQILTDAKQPSTAKVQAAATMFDLDQKKLVANYRRVLENESDPEARKQIQQQIQDLSGGSSKSFGDVVTAGNAFRMMANNLRDQLKNDPPSTDAELNDVKQRIRLYEQQAAEILGAAVDRRMGPGSSTAPSAATGQYKVGETRLVQSGPNKGKTARWDGRGWVLAD